MDPYTVLGIEPGSDKETIRRAYKAKAKECHPDKNKDDPDAKARFQEVQAAYESLMKEPDFSPFEQFFNFTFNFQRPQVHEVTCTLEELYTGCTKHVVFRRNLLGKDEDINVTLEIPKGCPRGAQMTCKGIGNRPTPQSIPGDVIFVVQGAPHPTFERTGDDLHTTIQLTLKEALLGCARTVKTLDGRDLTFHAHPGTEHGTMLVARGEGMTPAGSLIVTFAVRLPRALTEEQRTAIETLF